MTPNKTHSSKKGQPGVPVTAPPPVPPVPASPYVGPRSFRAGERLYGRERETNTLVDLIIAERIVLLYSPSGAGKSSLIQAALLPALKKQDFHVLPVIRVNLEPPDEVLKGRIAANRFVLSALISLEEAYPTDQRLPHKELAGLSLDDYLKQRCQADEQAGLNAASVVLVFDQFEEALTTDPTNREARLEFFNQLGTALRDRSRWALFSMREDYIAGLDPYLRPVPTRLSSRFRLDLLEVDGAMEAIRKPVRSFGMKFEVKAAKKLVDDLRLVKVQQPDGTLREVPGLYVEPVQLQVVCARLWQELPEDSSVITLDDVKAMGDINRALGAYYDSQIRVVAAQTGVAERALRKWFETRLITPQGIRALVPLGQAESDGLANEAVFALEKVYLIRSEKRAGATWFELAHDRLIRPVRESNQRWFATSFVKQSGSRKLLNYQWRAKRQGVTMTQEQDPNELLYFNGIDGSTGQYSLPPMTPKQFSDGILGTPTNDPEDRALKTWNEYRRQSNYAIQEGLDPTKLEEAGWGVVFPAKTNPAIVDALRPLLDWRKAQAGDLYKEYSGGETGVRPGESKSDWLARQGLSDFGPVNPENVPYYLMLVGSPQEIDYRFQYMLDVQYGVGRVCFDTVEAYANYAQSVVAAEKKQLQLARRLSFFGVSNEDDLATKMSAGNLIQPLAEYFGQKMDERKGQPSSAQWEIQTVLQAEATKARLADLLGGKDTPALLFTASHGMSFPIGSEQQLRHQGALLCQDWPGPRRWKQPVPESFYFSADDLSSDANLWGTIAFFFACYGAGTPTYDEFARQAFKDQRAQIAPGSFIAQLPQHMLAHPKGGALAAIGHVERAWGYSFIYNKNRSLTAFQSVLDALLAGSPVGYAFEYFNQRYAELCTDLTQALDDAQWTPPDPLSMANKWTATNDSKNYVVLGDPAVRAMVAPEMTGAAAAVERPSIKLHVIRPAAPASSAPVVSSGVAAEAPAVEAAVPASAVPTPAAPVVAAQVEPAPAAAQTVLLKAAAGEADVLVTVSVRPPVAAGGSANAEASSFGLFDNFQQNASAVGTSINTFMQKLGTFLGQSIENASTLQVSTYTSTNMEQVNFQGSQVTGAALRAMTAVGIDGDTKQVVPLDADGEVDKALWELHAEMVRQAQASRVELIKSAVEAVASLVKLGGPQ